MNLEKLVAEASPSPILHLEQAVLEMVDLGLREERRAPAICFWRCSALSFCARCLCREAMGESPAQSTKKTQDMLKRMAAGTAIHDRIQRSLLNWTMTEVPLGIRPIALEYPLWDAALRLSGRADILLDTGDGGFAIVEIKSASSRSLETIRRAGISDNYFWPQLAAYTILAERQWQEKFQGTVLYVESKDDPNERLTKLLGPWDVRDDWERLEQVLLEANGWLTGSGIPNCNFPGKCPYEKKVRGKRIWDESPVIDKT